MSGGGHAGRDRAAVASAIVCDRLARFIASISGANVNTTSAARVVITPMPAAAAPPVDLDFDALLVRLRNHINHGTQLSAQDLEDSAEPACLVLAAVLVGNLSRFRNARPKGNPAGPLTNDARAYARAGALAAQISIALEHRLAGLV